MKSENSLLKQDTLSLEGKKLEVKSDNFEKLMFLYS